MYKIAKSLIVAGLFVSVMQAQSGEPTLEAAQAQLKTIWAKAASEVQTLVTSTRAQLTVAEQKAAALAKDLANANEVKTAKAAVVREAQAAATAIKKMTGNQPSVVSQVKNTVSSAAGSAKIAAGNVKNVVVKNVSAMFNYLVKVGVNDPKVSNTRFYLVQGTKVVVVTAATAYALYYAYNKVCGEQTKSLVAEYDADNILVIDEQ